MSSTTSEQSRPTEKQRTGISSQERKKLNEDVRMIIRDCNALIVGILEYGNATIRLNQCSAFILTYMLECDEYYSGRSKGARLRETMHNFERLLEKLVELHTSIVPTREGQIVDDDDDYFFEDMPE